MSKQLVKLISVEMATAIPKKDGGTYTGTKIVYEVNGNVQMKGIHPNGLKFNEELRQQLQTLSETKLPKDVVLHTEKAENGFNVNVMGILPSDTPTEVSASTTPKSSGSTVGSGNHGGGNSTAKDVAINRAVALKAAIETSAVDTSVELKLELAKRFVKFLETGE